MNLSACVLEFDPELHLIPVSYANLGADDFGLDRCRYKHFFSNGLPCRKFSVVLSQMYSFVDRCSSEEFLGQALVRLFVEFRAVGYPIRILESAVSSFLGKYPFLKVIRSAWLNFLHRDALFWRKRFEFRS